jgi:hypothetical protein
MAPRIHRRSKAHAAPAAVIAFALIGGCSSLGDFDRLHPVLVTDDIHAWVGQEAAVRAGAPMSLYHLTEEERTLRDLAFPLIEPPYDRQRWDAVVYEYGIKHEFQRELWAVDTTAYYWHLQAIGHRSAMGRYNTLIDDMRNDIVRIVPFFDTAQRVLDLDRRREASIELMADLGPAERLGALARVGENSLTIAWVQQSLAQRCAAYRFALDHLVAGEPEKIAADADIVLTQLQQKIAANQVAPVPRFADSSGRVVAPRAAAGGR